MTRRLNTTSSLRTDAQLVYPFMAIVGQEEMKLALLLNVIAPSIGGVLIMGHRGTGKSTAVRALAALLPPLTRVKNCLYGCDPEDATNLCVECRALLASQKKLPRERARVAVVDLPLNATEDRVCGTVNIERALADGVKAFEPGLLARAHRGFLYIDEVNLLEDHLVDLLLDAATTGRNVVEREGISVEHPSRFVLIGSGNPEEGELRPQLLDRFGLFTEIHTSRSLDERVEIVKGREAFDRDPVGFCAAFETAQTNLRRRLTRAQQLVQKVKIPDALMRRIADLCQRLDIDGHRGELTIARAARALAAFEGRKKACAADVLRVAEMALGHRLRRDPLEQSSGGTQIERAAQELFGGDDDGQSENDTSQARRLKELSADSTKQDNSNRKLNSKLQTASSSPDMLERASNTHGEEQIIAPTDARLSKSALEFSTGHGKSPPRTRKTDGSRMRTRISSNALRGRYIRAVSERTNDASIALDATLRAAAAPRQLRRERTASNHKLSIMPEDLRYKLRTCKRGMLFIFVVDTSGSMAVNRINQAKGALARLLRQSYVNRDRVALISFRERRAEILLHASQSSSLVKSRLDAMPVGGATPLSAALVCALEVARRAATRGIQDCKLLIFTDGRANVPLNGETEKDRATLKHVINLEVAQLGAALQRRRVASVVVDTQNRFTASGEGQHLADALDGRYVYLPTMPT